jgi:hypothetical protein
MSSTGMWFEKYRPTKLSEIVNQTEIIGNIEAVITNSADMPTYCFPDHMSISQRIHFGAKCTRWNRNTKRKVRLSKIKNTHTNKTEICFLF